jgi:mono/diheme cytochrome c family protein
MPVTRRCVWYAAIAASIMALAGAAWVFQPRQPLRVPDLATLNGSAEEGAYLAAQGNCAACHTSAGGKLNAGGLKFKTDFGDLFSTNITSDKEYGIGAWSFDDFYRAMKDGVRPGGEHLYPAFPYTSFVRLTDTDIASLYLHFKTVPPVAEPNRANALAFPFNNRELMHFWKALYHDNRAGFVGDRTKDGAYNRGAYLVQSLTHCGACHSPRDALGGQNTPLSLSGGTYIDKVSNGNYRLWSAVDITPGPHGLAKWSKDDIVQYLKLGNNPHAVVHGPMNEVVMATTNMRASDLDAVATYLAKMPASGKRPFWTSWTPSGSNYDAGKIVYTVKCGTCHLPDGKGDKVLGVPLRENPIVQANSPASLINVILYGPHLPGPPFFANRTRMKPFGKRMSDEDIAAVSTYIRGSFGNRAGSVTAEDVARQR